VLINVIFLRKITLTIFTLMLGAIFIGGTMPSAGNLFSAPWDKVAHFFTFGAITLLAGLSFPNRSLTLIFLLAVFIGVADEVHQMFIAGRQPGLDDLLADILGAFVALPIISSLRKLSISPHQHLQIQR
jgi:VanZ family protein